MENPESKTSEITSREWAQAGLILKESFENGDAYTDYVLAWISREECRTILTGYYSRFVEFANIIGGLKIWKNPEWDIVSVWTFIPHNLDQNTFKKALKSAKLNLSGISMLIMNQSIRNVSWKLMALKRFWELDSFTEKMRKEDMGDVPHVYAQYLWANWWNWYGIRLLMRWIKELKEIDIPIYFWTVSKENHDMYKRLGFTEIGEKKDAKSWLSFYRFKYTPWKLDSVKRIVLSAIGSHT